MKGTKYNSDFNKGVEKETTSVVELRHRWRFLLDKGARTLIASGGVGVIIAVLLIFVYLLFEVAPLFSSVKVEPLHQYALQGDYSTEVLHLAIEEQSELAMRLDSNGQAAFFQSATGATIAVREAASPIDSDVSAFALESEADGLFALGSATGQVVLAQYGFETTFDQSGTRRIAPELSYPFGTQPIDVFDNSAIHAVALSRRGDSTVLAAVDVFGAAHLVTIRQQSDFLSEFRPTTDEPDFDLRHISLSQRLEEVEYLFVDADQRWLYVISSSGQLRMFDLQLALEEQTLNAVQAIELVAPGVEPTQIRLLSGQTSLLVADDTGKVSQWFPVLQNGQPSLQRVRVFQVAENSVAAITVEQRRKNFVSVGDNGYVGIFNTTAENRAYYEQIVTGQPRLIAVSPRGDTLIAEFEDGQVATWRIQNDHPEFSWTALLDKVWYENYSEPAYVWQSSAAADDFEPKFSLAPLGFGTLKAAFYAMLFAIPLAICGAIFTGYFMAPAMRQRVKPLIELMEALPTVVLGFLAGLWLAPLVENNLLGVFNLIDFSTTFNIARQFWLVDDTWPNSPWYT